LQGNAFVLRVSEPAAAPLLHRESSRNMHRRACAPCARPRRHGPGAPAAPRACRATPRCAAAATDAPVLSSRKSDSGRSASVGRAMNSMRASLLRGRGGRWRPLRRPPPLHDCRRMTQELHAAAQCASRDPPARSPARVRQAYTPWVLRCAASRSSPSFKLGVKNWPKALAKIGDVDTKIIFSPH